MKKFNNVKDYEKYLKEEFDIEDEVFSEYEWEDFNEFVGKNEYEIINVSSEIDVDDNVIIMNSKWYWIVERYEGMRFVEVDIEDIEYIKENM